MKRAILDTHALLWLMEDDPRLGSRAKATIEAGEVPLFVSYASLWEIAVKQSIGKLALSLPLAEFVSNRILAVDLSLLPIRVRHIVRCAELPMHHRDPFDRLLVAQCLSDDMGILSRDHRLDAYGVERIWE
jgi:PIN domain nuclease of toxin-antitoxin system